MPRFNQLSVTFSHESTRQNAEHDLLLNRSTWLFHCTAKQADTLIGGVISDENISRSWKGSCVKGKDGDGAR